MRMPVESAAEWEAEAEARKKKLTIIVLTVTVLIVVSQSFELGKEKLLEVTSEDMLPIMKSLFAELTLLGFIGVSLFLVFQLSFVSEISRQLYGDSTALDEVGETVHMVLFLVMVLFLLQAVAMARMGEASRQKWKRWEARTTQHLSTRTSMVASKFLEASWFDLMRDDSISSERGLRALLYAATRESVLHGSDDEFDFAHYLSVALGRTLAEIVEVPVKTWLGLEVALLVFFVLDSYVLSSTIFHVVVWSLLAWSGLVASYVVHAKLASVLRSHLEPHLRKALDADLFDEVPPPFADDDTFFSPQGSMDDDVEARDAPTRLQEVKIEESSLLSGSADSSPRRPRPPLTNQTSLAGSADATKKKEAPALRAAALVTSVDVAKKMRLAKKNYDDDDDNDAVYQKSDWERRLDVVKERLRPYVDGPKARRAKDKLRAAFAAAKATVDPYLNGPRATRLKTAVRSGLTAVRSGLGPPAARAKDAVRAAVVAAKAAVDPYLNGPTASNAKEGLRAFQRAAVAWLSAGCVFVGEACYAGICRGKRQQQRRRSSRKGGTSDTLKKKMFSSLQEEQKEDDSEDDSDDYVSKFWYGKSHRASFTLDVIRCIPLLMSIYLAVFTLVYVPALKAKTRPPLFWLVLIVAYSPAILLQRKLPSVVEDFAVAAHIADMLNLRYIEQVLAHQKTCTAFQALRAVAALRHPKLVTQIMKEDHHDPDVHALDVDDANDDDDEDDRLEKLIAEESLERRRRMSWANTFQLFDEDHNGTMNVPDLKAMLLKFADASDESEGHIDDIVAALDNNDDGILSFEEFYTFGKKLEEYYARRDQTMLVTEVFNMVDQARDGLINIEELHRTIKTIGLDLSLNVVYNLVSDIDDDGNGALDIDEFKLLMSRLDATF
eukprot:CAMPEP_0118920206 /NCGR_PEP_ID=MMETSP1166-20130328/18937_1 /TAXON_ID=1104430 /ORGANISM="Chrysoreinhardia sp, Strain CCMP3193" /LENGTH=891 /DNA_ID=CAMNT_0006860743 /DNA_START=1145 /DNA_END=3821 /DNA_ORIENTATION=+